MRALLIPAFLAALAPTAVLGAGLTVPVDQSRVLPIRGVAVNVVVGNREIADVRAVDTRTLVVIGKRPGTTSVQVWDAAGRSLFADQVQVSAGAGSAVTIYRGAQAQELACSPYCQTVGGGVSAATAPGPAAPAAPAAAPAAP